MKRLFVVALLAAGCGSGPTRALHSSYRAPAETEAEAPAEGRRRPTAMESTAIARIVTATEEVRGLTFRTPVRVDIESAARIAASLSEQITDEDVQKASYVYQGLGLLPADVDVRELLESVLGEQVVGYYDTDAERLVVREDVMRILVGRPNTREALLARLTLLHELVHALQDQWLDLSDLYESDHDSDDEGVVRSIAEGDAMLAMVLHDAAAQGRDLRQAALERARRPVNLNGLNGNPSGDDALGGAPAILRVTLVAPYLLGLRVVARAYYDGGWDAVNALFRQPPASMEEVIHLGSETGSETGSEPSAMDVSLPAFPGLEEAGFEVLDEDTLGELELGVYLSQNRPEDVDVEAAAGWDGDRLRVYRRDETVVVVWWVAFDDEENCEEAAAAAIDAGSQVERRGRGLLMTRHVPEDLLPGLLPPFESFAAALGGAPTP